MLFVFMSHTEGVPQTRTVVLSPFSLFLNNASKMRTSQHLVIVAIEVEIIRLVRVRAYRRVRFGKVERVRSHYRRH